MLEQDQNSDGSDSVQGPQQSAGPQQIDADQSLIKDENTNTLGVQPAGPGIITDSINKQTVNLLLVNVKKPRKKLGFILAAIIVAMAGLGAWWFFASGGSIDVKNGIIIESNLKNYSDGYLSILVPKAMECDAYGGGSWYACDYPDVENPTQSPYGISIIRSTTLFTGMDYSQIKSNWEKEISEKLDLDPLLPGNSRIFSNYNTSVKNVNGFDVYVLIGDTSILVEGEYAGRSAVVAYVNDSIDRSYEMRIYAQNTDGDLIDSFDKIIESFSVKEQ